jgi:hypothetical protein
MPKRDKERQQVQGKVVADARAVERRQAPFNGNRGVQIGVWQSATEGRRRRQRRSTTPRAVERYSRESTNRALRRLLKGETTN